MQDVIDFATIHSKSNMSRLAQSPCIWANSLANLKDQLWGHRGGGWWRPPCLCLVLVLEICLEKDGMDDIFMEIAVLFTFHVMCFGRSEVL